MKTIKDLNGKIWYRLIKVIYIIIAILVFTIIVSLNYNSNIEEVVDNNKTRISCQTLDGSFDIEKGIYGIVGDSLTGEQIVKIANNYCLPATKSLPNALTPIRIVSAVPNPTGGYLEKNDIFIASHSVMVTKLNVHKYASFIFGVIVSLLLFTEVSKRTFYYIVLGDMMFFKNLSFKSFKINKTRKT